MTQAEEPEIDLAAALKLPGPGLQPTKSHKPTRARAKPAKFPSTNNINTSKMGIKDTNLEDTTLLSDSSKINQGVPLKDQLTQKELKFLDIYLSGEVTMERAMLLAGYENYHPRYVYDKASKILQKYESQGGGAQKIFRAIGFGEVSVAKGIKKLATKGKSEVGPAKCSCPGRQMPANDARGCADSCGVPANYQV